jgi:S-DNA-T family DNA segregation ATPase FtsK/SpoIIIE
MAKRRGRPRKNKKVTYDSKETKFVLAILTFALGVFALLSYVITEDEGIFGIIRNMFGDATIIFSIFLLNLSVGMFGLNYMGTTKKSVVSQGVITLFTAAILAAGADPNPVVAETTSYNGEFGGAIGYEINYFLENFLLLNLTTPVLVIFWILLLPSVFNQNIAEFFGNVVKGINDAFKMFSSSKEGQEASDKNSDDQVNKPAMVGDFSIGRKLLGKGKAKEKQSSDKGASAATSKKSDHPKPEAPDFVGIGADKSNSSEDGDDDSITVKTKADGDGSTVQTELKYPNWKLPPPELLNEAPDVEIPKEDVKNNSTIIEQTLASFGIESKVVDVSIGPSVTQYALDIALGIKVSKISNLRNDLALALATSANAVRIEVPIPGTSFVGIEVPNSKRRPVFFRTLIEGKEMKDDRQLPVAVGQGIAGNDIVADIQKMPHLLIAGATGSGKSVLTVSFITSLLMRLSPDEVRFILVDPKQVELSDFNGIPHLLTPVIVDMDKVTNALKWAVTEMERRYTLFREAAVRNLEAYNKKMGFSALPHIVVVIDEMADMMLTAGKADIENNIVRLAQKARATGIHLILATQRPSVNVITGIIKANIPGRIGMSVTTSVDSRVILDVIGAESLLGKGDMLFKEPDKNKPARVQGVFISQQEVQGVVKFIKDQTEEVEYIEDVTESQEEIPEGAEGSLSGDDLFADAVRVVVSAQKGSSSLLQRKLSIGYNRAAKLLDEMAELGVVGPANGSKPRDVLIGDADSYLSQLSQS